MSAIRLLLLTTSASLLVACATTKAPLTASSVAPPAPVTTAAPGPAADDNLNAVAWTQTAVEHDLIYREVYRAAGEKLLLALKDRDWDALPRGERTNKARGLAPAVILDIDETVLDNSPYQARLVRDGKSFDEFSWSQWCREKAAKPMPGALEFTRLAAQHGVPAPLNAKMCALLSGPRQRLSGAQMRRELGVYCSGPVKY